MKKILFILLVCFSFAVASFAQDASNPTRIHENKIDQSGMRQGKWEISNAKDSIRIRFCFRDDIPSDTIFYYRYDSLKFTYIKSKTDTNRYIINDRETACEGYFTLHDIFYCSQSFVSYKKVYEYIHYEIFPVFPGGPEAMNDYLVNNMEKAPKDQSGKVKVDFVIDKAGRPTDVKIHESENPKLNDFCLKMIREMPVWQPGYQGGSLVAVPLSIPLKFK